MQYEAHPDFQNLFRSRLHGNDRSSNRKHTRQLYRGWALLVHGVPLLPGTPGRMGDLT